MGLFDRSPYGRFGMGGAPNTMRFDPVTGMPLMQEPMGQKPAAAPPYGMPGGPVPPWGQPQGPQRAGPSAPRPMMPQPAQPPMPDPQALMMKSFTPQQFEMPVEKQPQPGDMKQGGLFSKIGQGIEDFGGMNLMRMGLSLMGNAEGSNWGAVGDDLGQIMGEQQEQKRYERQSGREDKAEARTDELFPLQKGELVDAAKERARIAADSARLAGLQKTQADALRTTSPEVASAIDAMRPEQFGEFLGNRLLRAEDTKAQLAQLTDQNKFTAGQNALDRATQLQVADFRRTDPTATVRGRADMAALAPWQEAVSAAVNLKPRIQRMKQLVIELAAAHGINQPLDSKFRIVASRVLQQHPEVQGKLQELQNLVGGLTREEVQKLRPASNLDLDSVAKTMPGGDVELAASLRIFDRYEQEIDRGIERYNDMVHWMDDGFSLSGTNKDGKSFVEAHGYKPLESTISAQDDRPEIPTGPVGSGTLSQNYTDPETGDRYNYVGPRQPTPSDPNPRNNPKNWQKAQPGGYRGR